MNWVLLNPPRFLHERDEIQRLFEQESWITGFSWGFADGLIYVDADLEIHGKAYKARLTYPDLFPDTPPTVAPRTPERWTAHQYVNGGPLCLDRRADNWSSDVTGADLLRSTYSLLSSETDPQSPAPVQSAHEETEGQTLRGVAHRLVLTNAAFDRVMRIRNQEAVAFRTRIIAHPEGPGTITAILSHVRNDEGKMVAFGDIAPGILNTDFPWARAGIAWVLKSDKFQNSSIESAKQLEELILNAGFSLHEINAHSGGSKIVDRLFIFLTPDLKTEKILGVSQFDPPEIHQYRLILPEVSTTRLPSNYAALSQQKVGIVGLGSVGSKVATSLARSGIRSFVLVDVDVLKPENLTRNELNWSAVGAHKVDGVHAEIALVAPKSEVTVYRHRVAGQENSTIAAAVLKRLTDCNLIVDATADPKVFVTLAAVAKQKKVPVCWGEVFAGGIGALVARARPDKEPHPLAVRDSINSYLETREPAPYQDANRYDLDDEVPLVATDAVVTATAAAITQMALSTLVNDEEVFQYPAYLLGFRKEWIFSQAFDTQPILAKGPGWEDRSMTTPEEIKKVVEALAEVVKTNADTAAAE